MTTEELFENVKNDPNLEGVGVDGDAVLVRHVPDGAVYRLPTTAFRVTWRDLRDALYGLKTFMPISHMTRVCGYYSRVENWNPSKVAELHDRQKGNYKIH